MGFFFGLFAGRMARDPSRARVKSRTVLAKVFLLSTHLYLEAAQLR
jgi:hypothetical protein